MDNPLKRIEEASRSIHHSASFQLNLIRAISQLCRIEQNDSPDLRAFKHDLVEFIAGEIKIMNNQMKQGFSIDK